MSPAHAVVAKNTSNATAGNSKIKKGLLQKSFLVAELVKTTAEY